MTNPDIYREYGYDDRDDYLRSLADDYGVPEEAVQALADILGPDEDFDGLFFVRIVDGLFEIEPWKET